jgi:hypothetical protein
VTCRRSRVHQDGVVYGAFRSIEGPPASNDVGVLHGESLEGQPLILLDAFTIRRRDWITSGHNVERLIAGTLLIVAEVTARRRARLRPRRPSPARAARVDVGVVARIYERV